ncbi:MAG TPA: hypothetical protein VLB80_04720 [Candidatus Babeliales bacterium]|nr:hypothetical protein [Candidatus Babeliales bacterium]
MKKFFFVILFMSIPFLHTMGKKERPLIRSKRIYGDHVPFPNSYPIVNDTRIIRVKTQSALETKEPVEKYISPKAENNQKK